MKKLHPYCLMVFIYCCALTSYAQNLTEFDEDQIKRRATLRIQEFEELLQLISDPTRSRGAIDRYIQSSYSRKDSLFNQVFYDDKVIIEDDITPLDLTKNDIEVSALTVPTYLNNFKLQYQKYYEKTIFFTELELSDIHKEGFIYVIASYNSEFKGKNSAYKNHQYKPIRRNATLRAEYDLEKDRWQVWIAGVNYDRDMLHSPVNGTTQAVEKVKEEVTIISTVDTKEKEDTKATSEIATLPSLEFTTALPAKVKKGKNIALSWNASVENATVTLYQGQTMIKEIRQDLSGQQWNWKVQQKPGKDYMIKLYEPKTRKQVASQPFQVKPRIPVVLKVGLPLIIAGAVYYFTKPEPGPGPDPVPESNTIEVTPELPNP
ncbi:hypothetical protein [Catalinimonas niigatensis]|uniref:hypothetical protein n=1 Tax=Catalinimonas niigatensis TaxID=1397264 RepID=UPI0026657E70|nr:hypothetical protein [Catalinimonas niigatensis]WPP49139.1 hypothetical protein PZB72_20950 [Catalinimonas niigatensis]